MPSITVGPLSNFSTLQYSNALVGSYAVTLAQAIANTINTGTNGGAPTLNQFLYPQGARVVNGAAVAGEDPRGFGGVAAFQGSSNPQSVFINGADQFVVVAPSQGTTPGPVSLQGGAAGGFFIAGAGVAGAARNVTYTNITPTGTGAADTIVILGGNNLVQTATFGTGNYNVQTGDGNDTINILQGNSSINAGTGFNQINLGTGTNFIASEGNDTITGIGFGSASGVDTVAIGSGATSINSGGTSFLVNDSSPNQLFVTLGSGVDTVNVEGAGGASIAGINTSVSFTGPGTIVGTDTSTGDSLTLTGNGRSTITARGGSDTISARGTNGANLISAGTGNDTLIAGQGNDTLASGRGTALLTSGSGGGTTFTFAFNGAGGGADTISGLKGTDVLSFSGFGANPLGVSSTGSTAGGTTYSLSDGTTLTILGTQPATGQFRTS